MRGSRVQGLTSLGSILEVACCVAGGDYAGFHAFITKVNTSAIFWTITAVLIVLKLKG